MAVWGWDNFLEEIQDFLSRADREIETASSAYTHYVMERLEICVQALSNVLLHLNEVAINDSEDSQEIEQEIMEIRTAVHDIRDSCFLLYGVWQSRMDEIEQFVSMSTGYQAPTINRLGRGRPQLLISKEQLEYLQSLNFSWTHIAELLGVSRVTIYRRRRELGMLDNNGIERSISDAELRSLLQQLRRDMPTIGETLVMGHLRSLGFAVTRQRVRNAIHTTDPLNTLFRWTGILTPRRPYSVPSPNSLWHIDGHHKLVRWGIVTHGAIDGYSRLVVYLQSSNNNKAQTVYDLFLTAARQYGLPSRVRSDHGRENYLVAIHMLETRGYDRGSMITGSSVHNQRIERLWRDMHRCVTSIYYKLFYYLEHHGYLNPDNSFHRFALQYVYLPRINKSLKIFLEGWNSHGIRTEHHLSPIQLFVRGMLQMQRRGLHSLDFSEEVDDMYGVDNDVAVVGEDEYTVHVPSNSFTLSNEQVAQLQARVNPMAPSETFGIELYTETLEFLQTLTTH